MDRTIVVLTSESGGRTMLVDIGNKRFRVRLSKGQWAAVWVIVVGAVSWVVRVETELDVLRFKLAECLQNEQQLKQNNAKLAAKLDVLQKNIESGQ